MELYSLMRDAGLEPEPRPLAEIAIRMDQGAVVYRRWALLARSMLPKIVKYGLATEDGCGSVQGDREKGDRKN